MTDKGAVMPKSPWLISAQQQRICQCDHVRDQAVPGAANLYSKARSLRNNEASFPSSRNVKRENLLIWLLRLVDTARVCAAFMESLLLYGACHVATIS